MLLVALIATLVLGVVAKEGSLGSPTELWNSYRRAHGKTVDTADVDERAQNFIVNAGAIFAHNFDYERNQTSYKMALNKYADVVTATSGTASMGGVSVNGLNYYLSVNRLAAHTPHNEQFYYTRQIRKLLTFPNYFNWIDYNYNTAVRDQGECGSCWAFTVAAALEGVYSWYNGNNVVLSPQELIDCSLKDFGCDGGWFDSAFKYVADKPYPWLSLDTTYPYTGHQNSCHNHSSSTIEHLNNVYTLRCTGSKRIPIGDEDSLQESLLLTGPLPVALHVTPKLFLYSEGIFSDISCTENNLNHAVLLVGYGTDAASNTKYWILKNSWGEDWGEKGYFKLLRGQNMCGVAAYAFSPSFSAFKNF